MNQETQHIRAFVAIHVSPEASAEMSSFTDKLRAELPDRLVRWVRPEQIHLTLKFFGNVELTSVERLTGALRKATEGHPSISLELGAPGCFPSNHAPRVLWVGLDGDVPVLDSLQQRVVVHTATWGEKEEKRFHPHLTLGRVKNTRPDARRQIAHALQTVAPPQRIGWRVSAIHLMRSVLTPGGSRYSTLATMPLSGTQ